MSSVASANCPRRDQHRTRPCAWPSAHAKVGLAPAARGRFFRHAPKACPHRGPSRTTCLALVDRRPWLSHFEGSILDVVGVERELVPMRLLPSNAILAKHCIRCSMFQCLASSPLGQMESPRPLQPSRSAKPPGETFARIQRRRARIVVSVNIAGHSNLVSHCDQSAVSRTMFNAGGFESLTAPPQGDAPAQGLHHLPWVPF